MKKILLALLFAGIALTAAAQVRFETKSTDAIREMAVKAKKLVFIDLYATWCPPCRTMEKEVFSREDIGRFMDKYFVCAKYDIDKPTGKELMQKYKAQGVPTYLIFNTDGVLLGHITGSSEAKEFMARVQRILDAKK